MRPSLCLTALLLSLTSLAAEVREWKNPDGTRTFKGEYLSRQGDQVTIQRENGDRLTFPLEKLHADDRDWIERFHSLAAAKSTVFGNLSFGDTREEVYSKLEESLLVDELPAQSAFGSTGFTGRLRTKQQLGGLDCIIVFGWDDAGLLDRIDLKTAPLPETRYSSDLKAAWEECVGLLTTLHGKPGSHTAFPAASLIHPATAVGTSIWKLAEGGGAMVAITRQEDGLAVLVRFTKTEIDPKNPGGNTPDL